MPSRAEQRALPVHELGGGFIPIAGEVKEGGAAGVEGGVKSQLGGAGVAAFLQLGKALALSVTGPAADRAEDVRVFVGLAGKTMGNGFGQAAATPFGHVPGKVGLVSTTGGGGGRDVHQRLVAHDEEG